MVIEPKPAVQLLYSYSLFYFAEKTDLLKRARFIQTITDDAPDRVARQIDDIAFAKKPLVSPSRVYSRLPSK